MKGVIRLHGSDRDVIAVAQAAAKALRPDHEMRRALFAPLLGLHHERQRLLAPAAHRTTTDRAGSSPTEPSRPPRVAVWLALWGSLLGVGLLAGLVTAVMFGPPGRKNAYLDPELAVAVAAPAAVVALLCLVPLLFLPVREEAAGYGTTVTVIVGGLVAVLLMLRVLAGASDSRGFSAEQVAFWAPVTAIILLVIVVLAVRLDAVRRRAAPHPGVDLPRHRAHRRELRKLAHRLARVEPAGATDEVRSEWARRLALLAERGTDPRTVAQAGTMTPAAWLAWVCYDGEIDVSGILPRS
ncbi:hypothetical protein [Rhizomonospora bruguierae]|uniref:hypothetical protein n=1 Tax=Rhizomonospora bruguierae TaxID=1581705 RepID=UPI001BCAB64A|nr:hypothetical protein [Micromonospora sp. NBRC 107566]